MNVLLETERLVLRQLTEGDADLLVELDSDPEVVRHVGGKGLGDRETYRRQIQTVYIPYYATGQGFWAAVEKDGGAFVGWFHLRPATDHRFPDAMGYRPDELELGYRLRRAVWGRGYATEGARALLQYAFDTLGVSRVVAAALEPNVASTRVMEKLGMRPVGRFPLPGFDAPAVKYAVARGGAN